MRGGLDGPAGERYAPLVRPVPTAPIAAGSLVVGYAVAVASGSRPLGGLVLLACAIPCMRAWTARRGPRTATALAAVGLGLLIASHVLALALGAWPAVLLSAAAMGAAAWIYADAPAARRPDAGVAAR
jgi:hypothetical protein